MKMFVGLIGYIKTLAIMTLGSLVLLTALTVAGLLMVGCGPTGTEPNVEIIQDMMEQPALKAQDFHPYDREKSSMIVPPKGSWPKNIKPYLYVGDAAGAAANLQNPYLGKTSAELIQRGQRHFNNFCMVCHGEKALGNGPVSEKWKPVVIPSLMSEKIRNMKDGQIFHIITDGQGLMGRYIHQLPNEDDRWAVVQYIRNMQKETK